MDNMMKDMQIQLDALRLRDQREALLEQRVTLLEQNRNVHGDPTLRDVMEILIRIDKKSDMVSDMMQKLLLHPVVKEVNAAVELVAHRTDSITAEIAAFGMVLDQIAKKVGVASSISDARTITAECMRSIDSGSDKATAVNAVRASASASESYIKAFEQSRVASLLVSQTHTREAASAIHLAASGGLGGTMTPPGDLVASSLMHSNGVLDTSPGFN